MSKAAQGTARRARSPLQRSTCGGASSSRTRRLRRHRVGHRRRPRLALTGGEQARSRRPAPPGGEATPLGSAAAPPGPLRQARRLPGRARGDPFVTDEARTSYEDIVGYAQFPAGARPSLSKWTAQNAGRLRLRPWAIACEEKRSPRSSTSTLLLRWFPLEERVHRMRCVEAWSMVIPWLRFPLGAAARRLDPPRPVYVQFTTLLDREQLPGQQERRARVALSSRGSGSTQGHAPSHDAGRGPLRQIAARPERSAFIHLVVPWKYVASRIQIDRQHQAHRAAAGDELSRAPPDEYGFYASVDPGGGSPRAGASRATEREDSVSCVAAPRCHSTAMRRRYTGLYSGMDLRESS